MTFFRSEHCRVEDCERCVDGAALKCSHLCHEQKRAAQLRDWAEDETEMDRRIIEQSGMEYDPDKKMLVRRAS